MANVYTQTGANVGTNLVQNAYDKYIEFNNRLVPMFREAVDKRPVDVTNPGTTVTLQFYNDLAASKTPLTETVTPDSTAMAATSTVSVTVQEYGNVNILSRKLELVSLSNVDSAVADAISFNQVDTVSELVQDAIRTNGTNVVRRIGGATTLTTAATSMVATDYLDSKTVRYTVARLRAGKAQPRKGELFVSYVHPYVSVDLRQETGAAAWRDPHVYNAPDAIWAGEIGQYEGAYWIETARCYTAVDAGSGGNTVGRYRTYFMGRQAVVEATAEEPHFVAGEVTDPLKRFRPLGWLGLIGWNVYRQNALWRVETASSVDAVT